jgi:hypothetical protein
LAEAAKKPELELQVGNIPVKTFFKVGIKAKEETDTKCVFAVRLFNKGDAPAQHVMLRVIVNGKDVSVQSSSAFQNLYEDVDSEGHAIIMSVDTVRPHVNVGMDITFSYPKGQKPFSVLFNADVDELPSPTALGTMSVTPHPPTN